MLSPSWLVGRRPRRLRRGRHPVPPGRRGRGRRPDHHHPPRRPGDRRLLHRHREAQQGPDPQPGDERDAAALRHQPVRDRPGHPRRRRAAGRRVRRRADRRPTRAPWPRSSRSSPTLYRRPEGRRPARSSAPAPTPRRARPRSATLSLEEQGTTDATDDDQLRRGQEAAHGLVRRPRRRGQPQVRRRPGVDTTRPPRSTPTCPSRSARRPRTGLSPTARRRPTPSSLPGHLVCLD